MLKQASPYLTLSQSNNLPEKQLNLKLCRLYICKLIPCQSMVLSLRIVSLSFLLQSLGAPFSLSPLRHAWGCWVTLEGSSPGLFSDGIWQSLLTTAGPRWVTEIRSGQRDWACQFYFTPVMQTRASAGHRDTCEQPPQALLVHSHWTLIALGRHDLSTPHGHIQGVGSAGGRDQRPLKLRGETGSAPPLLSRQEEEAEAAGK